MSAAVKLLKKIAIVVVAVIVLESALAWTYMGKRVVRDEPVVDLIEQYAVLRPFRFLFPDQYKFPAVLAPNFIGEINLPGVRRHFWVADPLLGYRLAPNVLAIENVNTWYATNSQGFTITDAGNPLRTYSIDKPTDVFRIIILGNSLVQGEGATGSLTALPAQILRVLSKDYSPSQSEMTHFEVINAGVNGYHSAAELLFYLSELQLLSPDLVISYSGGSDMRVNNKLADLLGPNYPRLATLRNYQERKILTGYYEWGDVAVLFAKRTYTLALETLKRSATIDIAVRAARKASSLIGGQASELLGGEIAVPTHVPFSPDSVSTYAANMRRMAREIDANGATFAWILQPLFGAGDKPPAEGREQGYAKGLVPYIDRRKVFFELAREEQDRFAATIPGGNPCIADMTGVFDENPNPVYQDFSHLLDVGNEIVAERLAEILEACGLVRSVRGSD
jgi:hypothetical protein